MSHVAFQTHEVRGNLINTQHGRQPYFAIGKLVDAAGGAGEFDVEIQGEKSTAAGEWTLDVDGDEWVVHLAYQESGLRPKASDSIPADRGMHEFWVKGRPVGEDDRRKATFNVSPRWANQHTLEGDKLGSPFDHDRVHVRDHGEVDMPEAGLNVDVSASNVEARRIPTLFRRFVYHIYDALKDDVDGGFRSDYFTDWHPISNVQAVEGYVRHEREHQHRLANHDGMLWEIFHLLGDQEGFDVEYRADNGDIKGDLHKVKVREGNPEALVDGHNLNKQFKSYHPREIRDDEDDSLYHPKFGVLVESKWQEHQLYWEELEDIEREIEEAGVNVLGWAGFDVDPESGPWVPDDHFSPRESGHVIERVSDPTPQLKASQNSQILRVISEGTTADLDMVKNIVANGGEMHYTEFEWASSTVYRMKERLPELIESDNGWIKTRSRKLKEDLDEILNRTEREVGRLAHAVSKVLGLDAEYLDALEGELEQFIQRYGIDFREHESKLVADVGVTLAEIRSVSDDYPQVQALAKRLRRLVMQSPRVDDRPLWIRYENTAGVQKSKSLRAASQPA